LTYLLAGGSEELNASFREAIDRSQRAIDLLTKVIQRSPSNNVIITTSK
jgi:hypothetical protein